MAENKKPSLYDSNLEQVVKGLGQPAFRARQIYRQLYVNHAASPAEMTDLPKAFREQLGESFRVGALTLKRVVTGDDGLIGARRHYLCG